MSGIWAWIKEHPYATGGLVAAVIVLWLLIRSAGSSSSAQVAASSPTQAASQAASGADPNAAATVANNQIGAAVAIASLQADTANQQTSAARDVALQNILSGAQTTQYGDAVQLAGLNSTNAAQVAIVNSQVAGNVSIAGIQGQVATQQSADALAGLENTNATAYGIAGIQANTADYTTAAELALGELNSNNALAGLENTNAAGVQIAGITTAGAVAENAATNMTQQDYINTVGGVDLAQIAAQYGLGSKQIDLQALQLHDATALISSGVFNKGGEGGLNQVTAFLGSIGSPATSTSASAAGGVGVAQNSGGNTPAGILGGVAQVIGAGSGLLNFGVSGLFGPVGTPASAPNPVANLNGASLPGSTPVVTSTFTPSAVT